MNAFDLIRKLQEELENELNRDVKDPQEIDIEAYKAKNALIQRMIELVDEDNQILYGKGVGEIAQKETSTPKSESSDPDNIPF